MAESKSCLKLWSDCQPWHVFRHIQIVSWFFLFFFLESQQKTKQKKHCSFLICGHSEHSNPLSKCSWHHSQHATQRQCQIQSDGRTSEHLSLKKLSSGTLGGGVSFQRKLKETYQNMTIYQEIAHGMEERGASVCSCSGKEKWHLSKLNQRKLKIGIALTNVTFVMLIICDKRN